LKEAGKIMGIEVAKHLIITNKDYKNIA